jgi:hypothetical protein
MPTSCSTAGMTTDQRVHTLPVFWRRRVTPTLESTPKERRTGARPASRSSETSLRSLLRPDLLTFVG